MTYLFILNPGRSLSYRLPAGGSAETRCVDVVLEPDYPPDLGFTAPVSSHDRVDCDCLPSRPGLQVCRRLRRGSAFDSDFSGTGHRLRTLKALGMAKLEGD